MTNIEMARSLVVHDGSGNRPKGRTADMVKELKFLYESDRKELVGMLKEAEGYLWMVVEGDKKNNLLRPVRDLLVSIKKVTEEEK